MLYQNLHFWVTAHALMQGLIFKCYGNSWNQAIRIMPKDFSNCCDRQATSHIMHTDKTFQALRASLIWWITYKMQPFTGVHMAAQEQISRKRARGSIIIIRIILIAVRSTALYLTNRGWWETQCSALHNYKINKNMYTKNSTTIII